MLLICGESFDLYHEAGELEEVVFVKVLDQIVWAFNDLHEDLIDEWVVAVIQNIQQVSLHDV